MNIAILGVGNIGGTVGKKWANAGHSVEFGTRDVHSQKARALLQAFPSAQIDQVEKSLVNADVILVATPHSTVAEIARQHAAAFAGRVVIDATNNFGAAVVNNLAAIQSAAPTAQVFRAFNSLGWEIFAHPLYNGQAVEHFYCGPDNMARPTVEKLIAEVGVRPVWVGGNEMAPVVDALGSLWVTLVFQRGYPRHLALKLVQ